MTTKILDRFGAWEFAPSAYGTFAHADLELSADIAIRVLVGDDDMPTDWGDLEPSDEERAAAASFYVAVQVLDSDALERYHDGIGGVDVIDLPGYEQRDWEDAAEYALEYYLLASAEAFAQRFAHRDYSSARG